MKKFVALGAFLLVFASFSLAWWNYSWSYRIPVNVTEESGSNLTGFQVRIEIDTASLISNNRMNSDCSDIRVIDSDDASELSFWIEDGTCNTNETGVWTKLNLTANETKTIYIYTGNPDAASESDGDSVFEFFDDFSGDSLNASKWDDDGFAGFGGLAGYYSVNNGMLEYWGTSGTWRILKANYNITQDIVVDWRLKTADAIDCGNWWAIIDDDASERVAIVNYNKDNDFDYRFFHASSSTNVLDVAAMSPSTWYLLRNIKIGATEGQNKIFSSDGSLLDESSVYTYDSWDTTMYPVIWAENTSHWFLDWILVRKYASQDPSVSVQGVETPEFGIAFVEPTTETGYYQWQYPSEAVIKANATITKGGDNLDYINITLYNASGLIESHICLSYPCYHEFSPLWTGTYYLNATGVPKTGEEVWTATREIEIKIRPPVTKTVVIYKEPEMSWVAGLAAISLMLIFLAYRVGKLSVARELKDVR